jgi:hypothetical protein
MLQPTGGLAHLAASRHDQPGAMFDLRRDAPDVTPPQRNAAFGRIAGPAPLVDENRGPAPGHGIGPVPIGQQNQIIKRIGPAQRFMAGRIGRAHHHVIVFVGRVVRPQVTGPDRHRPICGAGHPVRPVQHPHNPVYALRCSPVALAFGASDAALADAAGIGPPQEAKPLGGQHHIPNRHPPHHSRCPDLAALVAR